VGHLIYAAGDVSPELFEITAADVTLHLPRDERTTYRCLARYDAHCAVADVQLSDRVFQQKLPLQLPSRGTQRIHKPDQRLLERVHVWRLRSGLPSGSRARNRIEAREPDGTASSVASDTDVEAVLSQHATSDCGESSAMTNDTRT
jgi:hypothetical protein